MVLNTMIIFTHQFFIFEFFTFMSAITKSSNFKASEDNRNLLIHPITPGSETSRAELGHSNFRAETELKIF